MDAPDLVVITPVFEDVEASSMLFSELKRCCGEQTVVIAVDDGSVKHPLPTQGIEQAGLHGVVIRLKRNVGHQRAISIGISYAAEAYPAAKRLVIMDSDGEDLPSTIPQLLNLLDQSQVDVVVAERKTRVETLWFKVFYVVYKWLFSLLTGRRISFGNFMAMKIEAAKRLASMGELATHVAATVLVSRLRLQTCPLDRGPRYAGESKMNFVGLALHGFRGVMIFAEDVLVRVGAACALVAGLSLFGGSAAIFLKALGYATPGWFSVALGILLLVFLQTGAITLMTLMLTGVVRGANMLPQDYRLLIQDILPTSNTAVDLDRVE